MLWSRQCCCCCSCFHRTSKSSKLSALGAEVVPEVCEAVWCGECCQRCVRRESMCSMGGLVSSPAQHCLMMLYLWTETQLVRSPPSVIFPTFPKHPNHQTRDLYCRPSTFIWLFMGALTTMKNSVHTVLLSDDVSLSGDYRLFRDKNDIQTTGRHNSSNPTHSLSWWRWNAVGWSGTHDLSITTRWMTWSSSSPGYGIWPLHTTSHANTPKLHTLAARVTCGGSVGEVWAPWILIFTKQYLGTPTNTHKYNNFIHMHSVHFV